MAADEIMAEEPRHIPRGVMLGENTSSTKDEVDMASIGSDLAADFDESKCNEPPDSQILDTSPKSDSRYVGINSKTFKLGGDPAGPACPRKPESPKTSPHSKKATRPSNQTSPLFKDGIKLKYQPPGEDSVFLSYHNGSLCKKGKEIPKTSYIKPKKKEYKVQKGPEMEAGQKLLGYWVPQIEEGARRMKDRMVE